MIRRPTETILPEQLCHIIIPSDHQVALRGYQSYLVWHVPE